MYTIERFLSERVGGPLNGEGWAGDFNNEMDAVTRLLNLAIMP
jgi:hypothetical protein